MKDRAMVDSDDGELSDDDLHVVIGGLEHPWAGAWDVADLGSTRGGDAARDSTA